MSYTCGLYIFIVSDMYNLKVKVLIGILAILTWQIDDAYGCSCRSIRHQNSFCTADFAIKANITRVFIKQRDIQGELHVIEVDTADAITNYDGTELFIYNIDILDVFKRSENFADSDQTFVTSYTSSSMCGVYLTKGIVYYLTGHVTEGIMEVSSCSAISEFDELTEPQLAGIQRLYARNCMCRLNSWLLEERFHRKRRRGRVCPADEWSKCEDKYAVCQRVRGERRCQLRYLQDVRNVTECSLT